MKRPPPFPVGDEQLEKEMLEKEVVVVMEGEVNSNTAPLPDCLVMKEKEVLVVERLVGVILKRGVSVVVVVDGRAENVILMRIQLPCDEVSVSR